MNDPIPIRNDSRDSMTSFQALKALGFIFVMLGPGIPLTILLWRLAVGGW